MAIGLCAFVVLGLVGLMGAGLDSTRSAARDTLLPSLAERVISELELRAASPAGIAGIEPLHFSYDGSPVSGGDEAFYRCEVRVSPFPFDFLHVSMRPEDPLRFGARVQLVFTFPHDPDESPEFFETAVARP